MFKKKKKEEYKKLPEPQEVSEEVNPMDEIAQSVNEEQEVEEDSSTQNLDDEKAKLQARIDELEGKKPKERTMVVRREEIPTQEIRRVPQQDGTIVNLITVEEALSTLLDL